VTFICSLFVVDNIQEAKDFYTRVLGQIIINDLGENVVFEGPFALHEKKHYKKLIGDLTITSPSNSSELYFEEVNLEKVQENLKKEGVDFVHEIREQPWRQQVLRIYDPSYNIIEIGESLNHTIYRLWQEGLSENEIGKTLSMTQKVVKRTLDDFKKKH
jgi:catechol 2,3-dioxygenase-like lactoylglutathione lyase family enzyme